LLVGWGEEAGELSCIRFVSSLRHGHSTLHLAWRKEEATRPPAITEGPVESEAQRLPSRNGRCPRAPSLRPPSPGRIGRRAGRRLACSEAATDFFDASGPVGWARSSSPTTPSWIGTSP
jgi:hypothetical protein